MKRRSRIRLFPRLHTHFEVKGLQQIVTIAEHRNKDAEDVLRFLLLSSSDASEYTLHARHYVLHRTRRVPKPSFVLDPVASLLLAS